MALELPALPYAYDALGPFMSKETLEFHHDKHHMAYVTNGNNLLKDSPLASLSIEEICKKAYRRQDGGPREQCGPALQPRSFLEVDEAQAAAARSCRQSLPRRSIAISAAMTRCAPILSRPA